MKSFVSMTAALAAGVALAAEVPQKQVVAFSSEGPDRYADGTVVADGECYALVWSKDGVFEGIAADGSAKDSNDRVVYIGSFAAGGKCEPVSFQIPDGLFDGGVFDLWLLDTRVFDNGEVVSVGKKGGKVIVASSAQAASASVNVAVSGTSAPKSAPGVAGGAEASVLSVDRASVPAPKIAAIAFDRDAVGNEVVVLDVVNTVPGVGYAAKCGSTPDLSDAGVGKKTSGNGGTVKLVMPKTGSSMFFEGVLK